MMYRLYILFVFAALAVGSFSIPGPLRAHFSSDNIDISIAENKEMIRLTASYPKAKAVSVHQYIKDYLGITDLTDMDAVEVKQYYTPDRSMNFQIKSKNGYLKITMKKVQNTQAAVDKLREAAKGIQRVLAGDSN